jgi:hypothetical protein
MNRRTAWIIGGCLSVLLLFMWWKYRPSLADKGKVPVAPMAMPHSVTPPASPANTPPPIAPPAALPKPLVKPTLPVDKKPLAVVQRTPAKPIPVAKPLPPPAGQPPVPLPPPPPVFVPPAAPALQEWKGTVTFVTHTGQVVVMNDRQWIHFWSEHHPHEASPDVDFQKNMVVGVFAGPRPADSFAIQIVSAQQDGGQLLVQYQEWTPPTGTFSVGVEVHPYDIRVVPRSALKVKFKEIPPKQQ